jgi:hypothetical protein
MQTSSREDGVTTSEFYYLLLVLGAFGAFAASMLIATLQYKAWCRQTAGRRSEASGVTATAALTGRPVARAV